MQYLFYFFTIPALWFEIITTLNPKKTFSFVKRFKASTKENRTDKEKAYSLLVVLYLFWVYVGLFTSQWLLFLLLLVLDILPFKKWPAAVVIDGVLSLILLFAILINKFHLHYSMPQVWAVITGAAY